MSVSHKGTTSATDRRLLAAAQGAYFALGGLWPVLHMPSFELVTGRKTDRWLVRTVGLLLGVIGATQLLAARRGRVEPETEVLSIASAGVLAAVDVVYWRRGILRWVYLLDAVVEAAIVFAWLAVRRRR